MEYLILILLNFIGGLPTMKQRIQIITKRFKLRLLIRYIVDHLRYDLLSLLLEFL